MSFTKKEIFKRFRVEVRPFLEDTAVCAVCTGAESVQQWLGDDSAPCGLSVECIGEISAAI